MKTDPGSFNSNDDTGNTDTGTTNFTNTDNPTYSNTIADQEFTAPDYSNEPEYYGIMYTKQKQV